MTIECVGGPWDGKRIADKGEFFHLRLTGYTGTYARFGRVYRWHEETAYTPQFVP